MRVGVLDVQLLKYFVLIDPLHHHLRGEELDVGVLHVHLVLLGFLEDLLDGLQTLQFTLQEIRIETLQSHSHIQFINHLGFLFEGEHTLQQHP